MRRYWQYDGVCWVTDCGNDHYTHYEALFTYPKVVDGVCPYCGLEIEE